MYPSLGSLAKPRKTSDNLDLEGFEPEQAPNQPLDLEGFEPLENVDLTNKTLPDLRSPHAVPAEAPPDTSLGEDVWTELNRPHIDLNPIAHKLAEKSLAARPDSPLLRRIEDNPIVAAIRGMNAGITEGVAGVASGFTSDLGLASMALPGVAGAIGEAAPGAAKGLTAIGRVASLPFAVHGAHEALAPNRTIPQRLQGVVEAAGGLAGALHSPTFERPVSPELADLGAAAAKPPEYNQPQLNFNLPEFHQLNLLDKEIPLQNRVGGPRPGQLPLTEEVRPEPKTQGKFDLDFQPPDLAPSIRNEFGQPEVKSEPKPFYGTPEPEPTKEPTVRLYRGESDASTPGALAGQTFTDDPLAAAYYAKQGGSAGKTYYVDLPASEAAKYKVNDATGQGVHILPPELAEQARGNDLGKGAEGQSIIKPKPTEEDMGKAKFAFDWPEIGPMYNVEGGPHHGSTLSESSLQEYGIPIESGHPELLDKLKGSMERDRANQEPNEFPQAMKVTEPGYEGNVAMGGADPRVLRILGENLYSKNPTLIGVKELIQNSSDEHKIAGTNEPIKVVINKNDINPNTMSDSPSITVKDKGRGLTKDQIYTVLTDVGKSGKMGEGEAAGGFGIAKASPFLGGDYVNLESTVKEGGRIVRHTFSGNPDELLEQKVGVPIHTEVMPAGTPTGLRTTVYYPTSRDLDSAKTMAETMGKESINNPSPIHVVEVGSMGNKDIETNIENYLNDKPHNLTESRHTNNLTPDLQDTIHIPGADINIHFNDPKGINSAGAIVHYLNKGLYQFSKQSDYSYQGELENVPSRIKVNIIPKVEEAEKGYPFNMSREDLRNDVQNAVDSWIKDNIISGARAKQRNQLKEMYANLAPIPGPSGTYKKVFFDPENKLTPDEANEFRNSPFIQHFTTLIDHIIHKALDVPNQPKWANKVENIGITLDPNVHGIHIPNPESPTSKSTILINPFEWIKKNPTDPMQAARENIATMLHEAGHVGDYFSSNRGELRERQLNFNNIDMAHPKIGEYFAHYIKAVGHAKDVQNIGHGLEWLRNLAEVYQHYGPEHYSQNAEVLNGLFTGNKSGSQYAQHVQDLLRLYTEREGRTGTKQDILSGTGVKSEATPQRETGISGNDTTGKKRPVRPVNLGMKLTAEFNKPIKPATPAEIKQVQTDVPQAQIPKRISNISKHVDPEALKDMSPAEKEHIIRQALNFQRTLITSYDISGPGRQGLPLIGRKEWWTSWDDMIKSWGSETAFKNVMDSIQNDPSGYFSAKPTKGNAGSLAYEAGLDLTDALTKREEVFRSQFAEKYVPGVRPSVRAYTAFLNKLRADTFKNMVKEAGAENNVEVAKQIANFINVSTGRGSLGAFEPSAKAMADIFFAPRYTASRIQNYTRVLDPRTYYKINPIVRKEILKSAIMTAGTGMLLGRLAEMAGAHVNHDPTNSDFGKIRLGKTRIDPFAGHQQYLVGAARMIMGKETSSVTGKSYDLNSTKFGMPTRADVASRFVESKLAPVPSFVWAWMSNKEFDGTPFNTKKALLNRTVPLVMQDIRDILKDNPTLLQLGVGATAAATGFGVQTYGR